MNKYLVEKWCEAGEAISSMLAKSHAQRYWKFNRWLCYMETVIWGLFSKDNSIQGTATKNRDCPWRTVVSGDPREHTISHEAR